MRDFIAKNLNQHIEEVVLKSSSLALLAHGDGIEVLRQVIKEDVISFIEPYNDGQLLEFFFVVEGKLLCKRNDEEIILETGDYFYAHNLKETVELKTLNDSVLLYITSKPMFSSLSKEARKLKEIAMQVEKKDSYTHGHGKRVRDLSYAVGKLLRLSEEQMENLLMAALFHDIGKIDVPEEILKKPGKLTAEEFEYIKRHPEKGARMVKGTFLENIAETILQHHERIDGSGYPNALKGDEICIEARIIGIVDSFDAMTSKRPYRDAMEWSEALEEIKSLAGKKYDAILVQAFEECIKIGLISEEKFKE
ncbi:phosphohydrolase [Kosmotoga arenicorallina S304]|uniref:Phosphohydrolase n=1 Tax=Kosmotoga arenicorallina S304 TaxID=1453497 RepID=A0A176K0U0_9BACT|nr:HD-GYP domain-containing protein [Kosmotoga arenicorallina]OAA29935.1 phosphohydrolase [Kosmotoga arenicorallina S304]